MSSVMIASLYVVFNTACLIAYIPQIISMIKVQEARLHVSLSMWGTWMLGSVIELMYAHDIHNTPWSSMALGHLIACSFVLGLGVWGHMEARKKATRSLPESAPNMEQMAAETVSRM